MKLLILLSAVVAGTLACDTSGYQEIGCFEIANETPQFEEIFINDADKYSFNINSFDKLPELVCKCFNETKDNYKFFSVGHNGHCHAGNSFDTQTPRSESCVKMEQHGGGLDHSEYVYQIKASAAKPIDGGASEYGPWGDCSASCGGGKKSRERACVSPLPNDPGQDCGNLTEIGNCNTHECPIDGGWSDWSIYGDCSETCGDGKKQRTRECDNPKQQHGGKECDGESSEEESCNIKPCPIDGGWSDWSVYGDCSETCGDGKKQRTRECDNPKQQHGGKECDGESSEEETCNIKPCPIDGKFGEWAKYSECSKVCGQGTKQRSRECDNPKQQHGGKECAGKKQETANCNHGDCKGFDKCEGKKVELSCDAGWKLKIDSFNYGRSKIDGTSLCRSFYDRNMKLSDFIENCGNDKQDDKQGDKQKVKDQCEDKNKCEFECNNGFFGDPCQGTTKYCKVKYHCEGYNQ